MIQKYIPLLFIIIIISSSSCSRYYYSPDDGHLLAINQKGDIHFSSSVQSFRTKDTSNHINIQIGYSPIKHLAIQSSFFYLKDGDRNDPLITGQGHMWSGAIGTYKFFEPRLRSFLRRKINHRKLINNIFAPPAFFQKNFNKEGSSIDLYFAHARGLSRIDYRSRGMTKTNFHKTYGQFGFHWFNKLGGISYSLKIGQIQFNKATSNGIVELNDLERLRKLEESNTFIFRESSFRIFTGVRQVKLFFNLTFLYDSQKLSALGVDNNNFTIGALVDIDECFRKKTEHGD